MEEIQLQDFDGHRHQPRDVRPGSRRLRKSISLKLRELTLLAASQPTEASAVGLARLHEADIISQVSTLIGATSIQIGKEKVLWSKGLLTLPTIVQTAVAGARVIEEQLTLLHIIATHDAFISGRRTRAMYAGIVKPLHGDLEVLMDLVLSAATAMSAVLQESSDTAALKHLSECVSNLGTHRKSLQDSITEEF
ncbi:hypothetical protein WJX84_002955 [Apatococcus fuscideae]|uniref:Uncharacterized protein n=1 Tax=Apatococcus fuscideae TaxID=2026836 RepID=A0AAW1T3J9_9CHLO